MINRIKQTFLTIFKIKDSRTKSVMKGSFTMLLSTLLGNLTRIGTVIMLSRFYSKEEFGIWATITATASVIAYSDFGIINALRNKLSQLIVLGENGLKEAKNYFFSSFIFFLFLSIVLSLLVVIINKFMPFDSLFKTNDLLLKRQGVQIILWVQFFFFLGIPLSMGSASFFSFQESKFSAIFSSVQAVLSFLIVLIFIYLKFSIVTISIGYFVTNTFLSLATTLYFLKRRQWFSYTFRFKEFSGHIKELISVGIKFMGYQLSSSFLQNAGTLVASSYIGLGVAAEFNLVQKLYVFFTGIYQSMFNPIWGGYAEAAAKNDWKWCKSTLKISLISTIIIFVLAIFFLYFFGNYLLVFITGKNYISEQLLFIFLGTTSLFFILSSVTTTFQNATNNIDLMVILTVASCFLIIPMSKLFVKGFDVTGIAIATTFLWLFLSGLLILQSFYIINKKLKIQT
jgi:O-antigen/teichoic acid export membrane protein